MAIEVKVPSVGESITEVTLINWMKQDGEMVEMDQPLCELESDKATVELPSTGKGRLKQMVTVGTVVKIGAVVAMIEEAGASAGVAAPAAAPTVSAPAQMAPAQQQTHHNSYAQGVPSPAASKILAEKGVNPAQVAGTGRDGRITKGDALSASAGATATTAHVMPANASVPSVIEKSAPVAVGARSSSRQKMTGLRKTVAKRLVEVKNTTAMLTTFNEVNMTNLMELRKKYKDLFKDKYDVNLGYMSFFTKACALATKQFPLVNGQIDGDELVTFNYVDMGIAVSTPKGLVVPVIRNAESLSLAQIEKEILRLAIKARDGKITIDDMSGGTFTITNGGVFGSMLSTPILNPPQSAILGMHNIVERPIAVNGKVEIHPIMYIALSYDHRIIDGRESVSFLKAVKEMLEDPSRLLLEL